MENFLTLRHQHQLYLSKIANKQHKKKNQQIKHQYENKILNAITNQSNFQACIGINFLLANKLRSVYRSAFMNIKGVMRGSLQGQKRKDLGKPNRSMIAKIERKECFQNRRLKILINKVGYVWKRKQKNQVENSFLLIKGYGNNLQKWRKTLSCFDNMVKKQYSIGFNFLKKYGDYNGSMEYWQQPNESLDFLNISVIQPRHDFKIKQKIKDSLQLICEEINTQESSQIQSQKNGNSRYGDFEHLKFEEEIKYLRELILEGNAKIEEMRHANRQFCINEENQIKQLLIKLKEVKNQGKENRNPQQNCKQNEGDSANNVLLGKYMRLCFDLEEKISFAVEFLQEIFNSQHYSEIHPELSATLSSYIHRIRQQYEIGQNDDDFI